MFRILLFLTLTFSHSMLLAAPDGELLFARQCSVCHGDNGEGGVGVPLSLPSFINSVPDGYLKKTIRNGRPGRIMPAFENLSDAQISAIVGYMRDWTDKPAPQYDTARITGDVAHGETVFGQFCAHCHGADARGGKGTGVTYSRKRDLPVIAPALNNAGFLASATDGLIKETIMFGREGTPMTSALVLGMSEQDVDDVVAYIRSFEKPATAHDASMTDAASIVVDSPYTLEETVENIEQAISDQNFTLIRTDYLDHGLVEEGKENRKQVVFHFCNFKFLYDALALDPRVGLFLPCRVTAVEKDGKVQVMTINPLRLSKLFNNDELDEACQHMHGIYEAILEDAVL